MQRRTRGAPSAHVIATLAVAAVFAASARAEQSQPWTWCANKEKASPDLQIGGCTTVIQSGKESQKNLSIAFNNRGNAYHAKGDDDRAVADYNESIRLDPKYAYPYNGRGNAYRGKGDNDRAIADYAMSIKLDPKYAAPHNGRGNAYRDKGDRDRALADYNEAIKLDPRYVFAYNGRGNTYYDKQD